MVKLSENNEFDLFPKMMRMPSYDEVSVTEPENVLKDLTDELQKTHKIWIKKINNILPRL